LLKQEKYSEAETQFREAVRLSPNNPIYHYTLGKAFESRQNYAEAEIQYRQALGLNPGDATYQESLKRMQNISQGSTP
jgi:Flp pilus assembly protein TadD